MDTLCNHVAMLIMFVKKVICHLSVLMAVSCSAEKLQMCFLWEPPRVLFFIQK